MPKRMQLTIQLLRRLPALEGADEVSLARLAALVQPRRAGAGQLLAGASPGVGVSYVIVNGWAEVRLGRETVALVGPGRFVGAVLPAGRSAPGPTVVSCAPMTLLAVDPGDMAALATDPVGCRLVETRLADRLHRLESLAAWNATA
jgi:CRP-like cAMP-binding protein